jgi:hypothetical protein
MSATGGVGASEAELQAEVARLRAALAEARHNEAEECAAGDDLVREVAILREQLAEQHAVNAALTIENTRLRAALDAAEARAALAPVADDYPAEVFRDLWRVLQELRAATGEEGRA